MLAVCACVWCACWRYRGIERHSSHFADLMYVLADIFPTELCRVKALRGGRLAVDYL